MNQEHSLKGLNVLITRPEGQGQSLGQSIAAAGGNPLVLPLLRITPVEDADSRLVIRNHIQNLDHYDMAIFISTNAARYGLQWIDQYWPQFPRHVKVFAVGPTTAAALSALDCDIHCSETGMQSEDLLALPALQHLAGLKVALFRGVGGRELLADTLRERGAQVDYVETYERLEPEYAKAELINTIKVNRINVILITSAQILDSLCHLVDITEEGVNQLALLVPSERVRQKALDAGFVQVYCSAGANDEAIIAGLENLTGHSQD